jgi:hypothetical protein
MVNMSDCQSWFGVARSKNRGFGGFFSVLTGAFFTSSFAARLL